MKVLGRHAIVSEKASTHMGTFGACGAGVRYPSDLYASCYKGLPELGICVSEPVLAVAEQYTKLAYWSLRLALEAEFALVTSGAGIYLGEGADAAAEGVRAARAARSLM